MKALLTAFFVFLPAAAQACMYGPSCGGPGLGGLMVGAVYAGVAVLGYWVLLQAVKESASLCIKRIGDVLGSVLVVVGLLGLLCAVAGHVKNSMCQYGPGPGPMMMAPGQPPGMGMMPPGNPPIVDEPAPAQKKAAKPK